MAQILVIDDAHDIRETLSRAFSAQGHSVTIAIDGEDGLQAIENNTFNDNDMPKLVQLILNFLQRKNAIDETPPVYWYSRKG